MQEPMALSGFAGQRDAASRGLGALLEVAEEGGYASVAADARDALARLASNRFHLAVMGQFKRGKSTLINALLAEDILPTGILPLTSVATEIRYGETRRAVVVSLDERRQDVPVTALSEYVTEKGNPRNEKRVLRVEIELPASVLRGGLVITDTPGLGSVYAHNTQAALDYLARADAGVLVLGVDPPISETEVDFVRRARRHLERLFFLLNKVDFVSPAELREALDFTFGILAGQVEEDGRDLAVRPISAKLAMEGRIRGDVSLVAESGIEDFERDLADYLARSKGTSVLTMAARRGMRLAEDLEDRLALEVAALRLPLERLASARSALGAAADEARKRHQDILFILSGELAGLVRSLDDDVDELRTAETRLLTDKTLAYLDGLEPSPPKKLLKSLETARSGWLVDDFEAWRAREEAKLDERLRAVGKRFDAQTLAVVEDVKRQAAGILDADFAPLAADVELAQDSRLWYLTGDTSPPYMPELNLLTFSTLLPRPLLLRRLRRDITRAVAEEVDRNCGRVRYDLLMRLEESGRRLKSRLEQRLEDTVTAFLDGLKRAEQEQAAGKTRVEDSLGRLERMLGRVREAKASCLSRVPGHPATPPHPGADN